MLDNYANACEGKTKYHSKGAAENVKINIEIANKNKIKFGIADRKNFGELAVYKCPFCHKWHVGHYTSGTVLK